MNNTCNRSKYYIMQLECVLIPYLNLKHISLWLAINEHNCIWHLLQTCFRMDSASLCNNLWLHLLIILAFARIPAAAAAPNSSLITLLQVSSFNYDTNGSTEAARQSVEWVNSNQALLPNCTLQLINNEDQQVRSVYTGRVSLLFYALITAVHFRSTW